MRSFIRVRARTWVASCALCLQPAGSETAQVSQHPRYLLLDAQPKTMVKELAAAGAEGYAIVGGSLVQREFLDSQRLLLRYDGRPREFRPFGLLPGSLHLEMLLNGAAAEGYRLVRELLEVTEYDDDDGNYDDDVTWTFLMERTDPSLPRCHYRVCTGTRAVLDDEARKLLDAGFEIAGAFDAAVVLENCPDTPPPAESSAYEMIDLQAKKEVVLERVKEAASRGSAVVVASRRILILKRACQACAGEIISVEVPSAFLGGWKADELERKLNELGGRGYELIAQIAGGWDDSRKAWMFFGKPELPGARQYLVVPGYAEAKLRNEIEAAEKDGFEAVGFRNGFVLMEKAPSNPGQR